MVQAVSFSSSSNDTASEIFRKIGIQLSLGNNFHGIQHTFLWKTIIILDYKQMCLKLLLKFFKNVPEPQDLNEMSLFVTDNIDVYLRPVILEKAMVKEIPPT